MVMAEKNWGKLGLFFFSSRRRHTTLTCDWSSDVCSSDLVSAGRRTKRPLRAQNRRRAGHREREKGAEEHVWRRCSRKGDGEIGRASCRERVWRLEVARRLRKCRGHGHGRKELGQTRPVFFFKQKTAYDVDM